MFESVHLLANMCRIYNTLLFHLSLLILVHWQQSYHHVTVSANNLPLLSGILRTYQVSACDHEQLTLECDSRTVISIVVAQYGQPTPQKYLCRSFFQRQELLGSNQSAIEPSQTATFNANPGQCPDANRLRYLFLQKVEATCREQNRCSLKLTPQSLGLNVDPCAHQIKFGEVAFKCRPNKFINKVICEGSRLKLTCNEEDRIVIYSAFFGATSMGVPQCPQTGSINGTQMTPGLECQYSYATESVMSRCHGRRSCSITADANTFGKPVCPIKARNYLKVVYTCVSKKMLKSDIHFVDKSDNSSTTTTTTTSTTSSSLITSTIEMVSVDGSSVKLAGGSSSRTEPDWHDKRLQEDGENLAKEPSTNLLMDSVDATVAIGDPGQSQASHVNCSVLPPSMQVIGFVSDWISAIGFIKKNQERLILYLLVSLFASLVCFLAVLSAKLYQQKRNALRKVREEQLPVTPFEVLDFDEDILDDDDDQMMDQGGTRGGSVEMHRQSSLSYSGACGSNLPSVSILAGSSAEPRPLLYSTLRKSRPSYGRQSSSDQAQWSMLRNGHGRQVVYPSTPSTMSTLPKSILANRNSFNSTAALKGTTAGDYGGSIRSSGASSTVSFAKRHTTNSDREHGTKVRTPSPPPPPPSRQTETDDGSRRTTNQDQDTQPRMLSKSLNNFFI